MIPCQKRRRGREDAIWSDLAWRNRGTCRGQNTGGRYQGVAITNGFSNTIPWVAASQQHTQISAISKHPYPRSVTFPKDAQKNAKAVGARRTADGFRAGYAAFFPEYRATAIQTETVLRDITPGPNDIYGLAHGRMARSINGGARTGNQYG